MKTKTAIYRLTSQHTHQKRYSGPPKSEFEHCSLYCKMTEKRQVPTPGVRLMKVSVNRELTVLTKRVCGIISQGDTFVNTKKTITTTTHTGEGGTKDVYYSLLSAPPPHLFLAGVGFPLLP